MTMTGRRRVMFESEGHREKFRVIPGPTQELETNWIAASVQSGRKHDCGNAIAGAWRVALAAISPAEAGRPQHSLPFAPGAAPSASPQPVAGQRDRITYFQQNALSVKSVRPQAAALFAVSLSGRRCAPSDGPQAYPDAIAVTTPACICGAPIASARASACS